MAGVLDPYSGIAVVRMLLRATASGGERVIRRKNQREIETMRKAGVIVAEVHRACAEAARPGVSTADLDALAEEIIRSHGAKPTFLGYRGFPASICASINEEVVHGIPSDRQLAEGDLVSLDFGVLLDGWYGDSAITVPVGAVSEEAERLSRVTRECLHLAIEEVRPGRRLSDIGHAVEAHATAAGFGVVREFVGHGIGTRLHEEPQVPNFGAPGRGPRLEPGMVLAIEPMITAGDPAVKVLGDGWTAVTRDGSLAAHWELVAAVTPSGPRVLGVPAANE